MFILDKEIHCVEWRHRKGDDIYEVFGVYHEDETPLDASELNARWDISDSTGVLVSLSGSDLTIDGNEIEARKAASFFDDMYLLGEYTHRFYDSVGNHTFFEGKFKLV